MSYKMYLLAQFWPACLPSCQIINVIQAEFAYKCCLSSLNDNSCQTASGKDPRIYVKVKFILLPSLENKSENRGLSKTVLKEVVFGKVELMWEVSVQIHFFSSIKAS